jgi:N-acetylneuraminate synthase/N,N'-diacetyllegionaminate synthase
MIIKINGRAIGSGERPYIIAEAGINFLNNVDLGKAFIDAAAEAGADAIKFQTHVPDGEMVRSEMERIGRGDIYETVTQHELTESDHEELQAYARDRDITFFSTPYSVSAVRLLESLDVPAFKIGSGELTNEHLLREAADSGEPLLVSTGMAQREEVRETATLLNELAAPHALFYCVSAYPTPIEDIDLDTIDALRSEFGVPVGFSDHTLGTEASVVAMARGADIIEKHFTLDRTLPGPDQEVSIEPDELAELVGYSEVVDRTSGRATELTEDESEVQSWARHSVVAEHPVIKGETFTADDLTTKRPNTGLPARRFDEVVGATATRDIAANTLLTVEDIDRLD